MRRAMWPALTLRFARQYACSVLSKVSLPQRGPARSAPAVRGRGLSFRRVRLTCGALLVMFLAVGLTGCSCEDANSGAAETRDPVTGLTPAEAREVLVKVGDRSITLGDFVATLLRMDRFERLRYQTEERQKQLLDEMIQVELLAQEAKKRGLDKDPEVTLRMQQALRDELLRQVEAGLPAPEDIVEREVREYYDAHRAEFKEPERRRVLMIRVGTRAVAEEVLEKARGASGAVWGELAKEYHLDRIELKQDGAPELSGDRGFVSAPGEKVGENDSVPDEVRRAIFEVKTIGDVVPRPLEEAGSFFIARLGGISPARDRSVADADRAIRVELRRQKFIEAEKKLEAELRKKYPVVIDEKAIERYQASLPPAPKTPETSPAPVPTPAPEAPAPVAPAPVAPAPSPAPTPAPAAP